MEVYTCAYENSNVSNSNSDYYGKINMTSVIMCFLIIYNTALSIVLSVKQLIQVIKEEELINEEEEEEEEVVKEVEVEVIKEEEVSKEVEEEELLLANYNAKERALALQAAYDERAKLMFEKWEETYYKLDIIRGHNRIYIGPSRTDDLPSRYRAFLSKAQEEYLETNEKLTRLEAFNALKKARTLDLNHYKEFIHLFNS
jgi:hypothetical protein